MHRSTALVLVALLTAGCANLGGKAVAPQESVPASHALVVVHDLGPHDANVTMRLTMPNGSQAEEWFLVGVGKTVEHRMSAPVTGNLLLRVVYAWSQDGHGASGVREFRYGADACPGTYRVDLDVDTTASGSWSNEKTACLP